MSEPDAGHDQLSVINGAVPSSSLREQDLDVLVHSYRQRRRQAPRQLAAGCVTPRIAEPGDRRHPAPAMRPHLVVLDVGQFTVRCRWCQWVSDGCPTLGAANRAFEAHVCEEPSP